MSLVVALGAGGPGSHVADWSLRLLNELARRGDKVVVVDRPENLSSVPRDHPAVQATVAADFADAEAVQAATPQLADAEAIVGFREYCLRATAALAQDRGVPWNSVAAVERCRNKDETRQLLHDCGLPQPTVHRFATSGPAIDLLTSQDEPLVVKPRDAYGSQGVCLVSHPDQAERAVSDAFRYSREILVETFVDGEEFSVEGVILAGTPHVLAVTAKTVTAPPRFVELGHRQPSGLDPTAEARLTDTAVAAVQAVGLTHSLFHVEAWLTAAGEVICGEVHGRVGGDWIHTLTAYRYPGLDTFGVVVDDVLRRTVDLPGLDPSRAAAAIVIPAPSGRVVAVHRPRFPSGVTVLAEDWAVHPGDHVLDLADSFSRAGLIALGAPDLAALDDAVQLVRSTSAIECEPASVP